MPRWRREAWRSENDHGVGPDEEGGQAVEHNGTNNLSIKQLAIVQNGFKTASGAAEPARLLMEPWR